MQSFGQDTGYVFKQAAAGDMRQRTDSPAMNKRKQRLHIDSGGSHQGIDQQNILIEQSGTLQLRSEEHTSELQSLMRISYADLCLKKKKTLSPATNTLLVKH